MTRPQISLRVEVVRWNPAGLVAQAAEGVVVVGI